MRRDRRSTPPSERERGREGEGERDGRDDENEALQLEEEHLGSERRGGFWKVV